jgi:AmmeMemoRadiSam system protein B
MTTSGGPGGGGGPGGPAARIRQPAVAGSFYPASRSGLVDSLQTALAAGVNGPGWDAPVPKALVVPHAGYMYSGPVAASAYLRLRSVAPSVGRVVLLGPSHYVPVRGVAVSAADAFATPLGLVPLDAAARTIAVQVPAVHRDDAAHAPEHSLEVQLPFLQTVLPPFEILPLLVGPGSAESAAAVLQEFWDLPGTVVIVSTDLSHYHPYVEALARDRHTAAAIERADPGAIRDEDACGAAALRGLLSAARARHLSVKRLDLRNSGDTAGGRDQVVGYGAFAVC